MKKIFTFLFVFHSLFVLSQVPQGFSYQATVRNSSGQLVVNQNVYFKFNIMQDNSTAFPVYSETHYVPTDEQGHVNIVVGAGTATTGNFSQINWATGTYYLGIELNTGSGYVAMGTTQLLSVPFALYAQNSGNSNNIPSGNAVGDMLYWNGSQWVTLSPGLPGQLLYANASNLPTWGFNVNVVNVRCNGENNGVIEIFFPDNAVASNYTYQWTNSNGYTASNQNIYNLAPGNYTLVMTEGNGTPHTYNYTISQPQALVINLLSTVDATCYGLNNGTVNLNLPQGNGFSTFTAHVNGVDYLGGSYSNSVPVQNNAAIQVGSLPAGTYNIYLESETGCISNTESFAISQPTGTSLAGQYTLQVVRLDNSTVYNFPQEDIDQVSPGAYNTETTGSWSTATISTPDTGFTFRDVCGSLVVDTQNLFNGTYANLVTQSPAQAAASFVNPATGVLTIEYSVWFTNNTVERPFRGVYTPN